MAGFTLYTNPRSRGRIAHWMMEESGVDYAVDWVDFGPPMKGEAYRRLNPMGKVPTLVHDGRVVTECAAICAYMAEAAPEAGLAPRPEERADYFRWLFYGAGPLEQAVVNRALGVTVPPERRGMVGYGSFEAVMDTLDAHFTERAFVAGDRFTAADVYVGSQIGWGLQFGSIERRPSFEAYWARLKDRPALARVGAANETRVAAEG
jgi:glutathione S-transferase